MAENTSPITAHTRDIVVMGASAGGIPALQAVLAGFPAELQAAVLVVLHLGAESHLAQVLGRAGPLPVEPAESGTLLGRGRVYVAVPGCHLLVHDHHLLLRRGPRENLSRPAIDPLFRSAAITFGSRVVGVVLSGALNDGTAGLRAIKRCGGLAVVQDPSDAAVRSMPLSALRFTEVDYVAPAAALGPLLGEIAGSLAGPTPAIPYELKLETAIAAQELSGMATDETLGRLSPFTCPECNGALWEIDDGSFVRYRCHVGHALTGEAMMSGQARQGEELLWSLLRLHQQRAELARRMAAQEAGGTRNDLARILESRARGYDEDAEVVRLLLKRTEAAATPAQGDEDA